RRCRAYVRAHPAYLARRIGGAMTDRQSRREFMGMTAFGLAGAAAMPRFGNASTALRFLLSQRSDPDLVVLNATIYTMDPGFARAEAFAVSGSRIIAVG